MAGHKVHRVASAAAAPDFRVQIRIRRTRRRSGVAGALWRFWLTERHRVTTGCLEVTATNLVIDAMRRQAHSGHETAALVTPTPLCTISGAVYTGERANAPTLERFAADRDIAVQRRLMLAQNWPRTHDWRRT
jgi:hypothetical protein